MMVAMIDKGQERQGSSPNRESASSRHGGKIVAKFKAFVSWADARGWWGCRIIPESLGGGEREAVLQLSLGCRYRPARGHLPSGS